VARRYLINCSSNSYQNCLILIARVIGIPLAGIPAISLHDAAINLDDRDSTPTQGSGYRYFSLLTPDTDTTKAATQRLDSSLRCDHLAACRGRRTIETRKRKEGAEGECFPEACRKCASSPRSVFLPIRELLIFSRAPALRFRNIAEGARETQRRAVSRC